MFTLPIYNLKGEKSSKKISLPRSIFEVETNQDLLHQVITSTLSRQRKSKASVKKRSEVSGGGRKPWRQKGTGRARAGTIRSPLWRGGGVVFGPKTERNYKKEIPKKMKRKVFFSILTDKLKDNKILILEDFKIKEMKTKKMLKILEKIPFLKSALILLPQKDLNIQRSCTNIPGVKAVSLERVNILDILNYNYLLITKEALKKLEEKYGKV